MVTETALLELIELADGEVTLQRVNGDGKPLVKIRFSQESEELMASMKMTVVRAMIEAGIDAFAELNAMQVEDRTLDNENVTGVLH